MSVEARYKYTAKDGTKPANESVKQGLVSVERRVLSVTTAVAGLAGAGGMVALVKMQADAADGLAKTSDKIGIATEKLSGLHHVTRLYSTAGVGAMNEALTKASKRLGEFNATGGGAAARWLQQLNMDTQELAQLAPDQLFERYAGAISGLNSRGEQLAAISALMGDESRALIGVIDEGVPAIRDAQQEVLDLGLAMTRVDAAKIEAANDSFTRVQGVVQGLGNAIAVEVAPVIEHLATEFVGAAKESGGLTAVVTDGMETVAQAVGFAADTFRGLNVVWSAGQVFFATFAEDMLGGIARIDSGLTTFLNKFSAVSGKTFNENNFIQDWADSAAERTRVLETELMALVSEPMPSGNIKQLFDEIRSKAQESAEQVAATRSEINAGGQNPDTLRATLEEEGEIYKTFHGEQLAREQEQQDARLAAMRSAHFERVEMAREAADEEIVLARKVSQQKRREQVSTLQATASVFSSLSTIVGAASKKQFDQSKKLQRVSVIMSTAAGIMRAYSDLGPIAGAVAAVAIGAQGVAQLAQINRTQFSGGGGISAGGVNFPAPTAGQPPPAIDNNSNSNAGQASAGGITNFIVIGMNENTDIDALLERAGDEMNNSDKVMFSVESRQAQNLIDAAVAAAAQS